MSKKMKYVVRVAQQNDNKIIDGGFIECLRYMGLVKIHSLTQTENTQLFDIYPPSHVADDRSWAESQATRMKSFGFIAECCPSPDWNEEKAEPVQLKSKKK